MCNVVETSQGPMISMECEEGTRLRIAAYQAEQAYKNDTQDSALYIAYKTALNGHQQHQAESQAVVYWPDTKFKLEYLESLPTLATGQADNLKIDTGSKRVWLSRCTVEDGEPYNNKVTIEQNRGSLGWVAIETYQAL